MSKETCPKCGHEFEGGIKLVPPMPDPPPKSPLILQDPPQEGQEGG